MRWSRDCDYGFFAIELEEPAGVDIAAAAEAAYRELAAFIHETPTRHVLRLWNYFDAINEGDGVAIVGRSGRAQIVESVFARLAAN